MPVHDRPALSRRTFLGWGAATAAALAGLGVATPAFAATTPPPSSDPLNPKHFGTGDVGILNYALLLEYLQSSYYDLAVQAKFLGSLQGIMQAIAEHEAAHVATITGALRSMHEHPIAAPGFQFPRGAFHNRTTFLRTAANLEAAGVMAYQSAIYKLANPKLKLTGAAIAGTESRHASVIQYAIEQNYVPGPEEISGTQAQVLAAVRPYVKRS